MIRWLMMLLLLSSLVVAQNQTNDTLRNETDDAISWKETMGRLDQWIGAGEQLRRDVDILRQHSKEIEDELKKMQSLYHLQNMSREELISASYGLSVKNMELEEKLQTEKNRKALACADSLASYKSELAVAKAKEEWMEKQRNGIAVVAFILVALLLRVPQKLANPMGKRERKVKEYGRVD